MTDHDADEHGSLDPSRAPQADEVPIHEVGAQGKTSLELRGTVLIYRVRTMVGSAATYIPIEWVRVSRHWRFRGMLLLRFAAALLLTGLVTAGIVLYAQVLMPLLALVLFGGLLYAAITFAKFWRGHPTVRFSVDIDPQNMHIECWDPPGRHSALGRLTQRIAAMQKNIDEHVTYPVRMTYQSFNLRPFRATMLHTTIITLVLLFPVDFAARYFDMPWIWAFLALPALVYLGSFGLQNAFRLTSPRDYRDAVRAHDDGNFADAERHLNRLLTERPDHISAMLLLVQVHIRLRQFRRALQVADRIGEFDEDYAADLQQEIIGIQRMHQRMGEKPA